MNDVYMNFMLQHRIGKLTASILCEQRTKTKAKKCVCLCVCASAFPKNKMTHISTIYTSNCTNKFYFACTEYWQSWAFFSLLKLETLQRHYIRLSVVIRSVWCWNLFIVKCALVFASDWSMVSNEQQENYSQNASPSSYHFDSTFLKYCLS